MIRLQDMTVGDRWPFPYFRLWEWVYSGGKFVKQEIDLSTDFSSLKFSARLDTNNADIDDHNEDDVDGTITVDSGGLCHFEWGASDTTVKGHYTGRLWGTRTDGRIWHSKYWYEYWVTTKGRSGREDI